LASLASKRPGWGRERVRRTYPTAGLDWFEQLHPLCRQYTMFSSGVPL